MNSAPRICWNRKDIHLQHQDSVKIFFSQPLGPTSRSPSSTSPTPDQASSLSKSNKEQNPITESILNNYDNHDDNSPRVLNVVCELTGISKIETYLPDPPKVVQKILAKYGTGHNPEFVLPSLDLVVAYILSRMGRTELQGSYVDKNGKRILNRVDKAAGLLGPKNTETNSKLLLGNGQADEDFKSRDEGELNSGFDANTAALLKAKRGRPKKIKLNLPSAPDYDPTFKKKETRGRPRKIKLIAAAPKEGTDPLQAGSGIPANANKENLKLYRLSELLDASTIVKKESLQRFRLSDLLEAPEMVKRKRGRPRKVKVKDVDTPKRKRGRPRKHPIAAATSNSTLASPGISSPVSSSVSASASPSVALSSSLPESASPLSSESVSPVATPILTDSITTQSTSPVQSPAKKELVAEQEPLAEQINRTSVPAQQTLPLPAETKRKRGRPRKEKPTPDPSAVTSAPKRGRPKKTEAQAALTATTKKKRRGRPRKVERQPMEDKNENPYALHVPGASKRRGTRNSKRSIVEIDSIEEMLTSSGDSFLKIKEFKKQNVFLNDKPWKPHGNAGRSRKRRAEGGIESLAGGGVSGAIASSGNATVKNEGARGSTAVLVGPVGFQGGRALAWNERRAKIAEIKNRNHIKLKPSVVRYEEALSGQ